MKRDSKLMGYRTKQFGVMKLLSFIVFLQPIFLLVLKILIRLLLSITKKKISDHLVDWSVNTLLKRTFFYCISTQQVRQVQQKKFLELKLKYLN